MNKIIKFYKNNKNTINNLFWRFIQIFGREGISVLTFFLCAYLLTPYQFGLFNYILSIISFIVIFGDFGISTALSKIIAEYNVNDKNKIKEAVFSSLLIVFFICIILSAIILLLSYFFFKENLYLIIISIPLITLMPLCSIFDGIYRGLKKFKNLTIISLTVGFLSFFYIYFLVKYFNIYGAIVSRDLYYLFLLIPLIFFTKSIKLKINYDVIIELIKYSIVLGITGFMYFLYTKVDILILKHYGYVIEIGYYEIINKITMLAILPFVIFGQVTAPDNTKLYIKNNLKKLRSNMIKQIIYTVIISLLYSIILYIMLPVFIKIFFNKYYNKNLLFMLNMMIIIFPVRMVGQIINHGYTVATGNAHLNMLTMIPAAILNILLDFLFINKYGYIGVIYSTMICFTFGAVSLVILFWIKIKK